MKMVSERRKNDHKIMKGFCPDEYCRELLAFTSEDLNTDQAISCHFCGRRWTCSKLISIEDDTSEEAESIYRFIKSMPKRPNVEFVRYHGLTNCICKIVSPMFTKHGINKNWIVKPLEHFGLESQFDPILLSDKAFYLDADHLFVEGFVMNKESAKYLQETMAKLNSFESATLFPLIVSSDENSLFESISRATIGREIFWHPLKEALKLHLVVNEKWYLKRKKEFGISEKVWSNLLEHFTNCQKLLTADQNILLVFALSNLLARPIFLFDSFYDREVHSKYSFVFLPILRQFYECKSFNKTNKPLIIAWADENRNCFVPLISAKGQTTAKLHFSTLPPIFMAKKSDINRFVDFDEKRYCEVASGRCTSLQKIEKMIRLMSEEYAKKYLIPPQLINDYIENVGTFPLNNQILLHDEIMQKSTNHSLWRCLICWRLNLLPKIKKHLLINGGAIYNGIASTQGKLQDRKIYSLPPVGTFCYDVNVDEFKAEKVEMLYCKYCSFIAGQMREQYFDGKIFFENGDHTRTFAPKSFCMKKVKHFWNNDEYDNYPAIIQFQNTLLDEKVAWFQFESDPLKNSDSTLIAINLISNQLSMDSIDEEGYVSKVASEILASAQMNKVHPLNLCRNFLWSPARQYARINLENDDFDFSQVLERCLEVMNVKSTNEKEQSVETAPKDLIANVSDYQNKTTKQQNDLIKVRVVRSGREKICKRIAVPPSVDFNQLMNVVCDLSSCEHSDVFNLFHKSQNGKIRMFHIGQIFELQRDDIIYVQFTTKRKVEICHRFELRTSLLLHLLKRISICFVRNADFWQFVTNCPSFFRPEGVIYDLVLFESQLKHSNHFALPGIFPAKIFVYCAEANLVKLCIEQIGHFVIDEEIQKNIRCQMVNTVGTDVSALLFDEQLEKQPIDLQPTLVIGVKECKCLSKNIEL